MSYTLRIYTDGLDNYTEQSFATLELLYASVFNRFSPEAIDVASVKEGINLNSGWAVYDDSTGLCINSINAAQVGWPKSDPRWQPFGPQTLNV